MPKFEYAIEQRSFKSEWIPQDDQDRVKRECLKWLNNFGLEGWEIVQRDFTVLGEVCWETLLLKRQIDG